MNYAWRYGKYFDRRQWVVFIGWFIVFQAVTFYIVASRYLPYIQVNEPHARFYLATAYVAHFGLFPALAWLILVALALIVPFRVVLLPTTGLVFIGTINLLIIDTSIYDQYRFHLSGFIWELVTGPGAAEMFQPSWHSLLVVTLVFFGTVVATLVLLSLAALCVMRNLLKGRGRIVAAVWFIFLLISQLMHVWYEAHYDVEVTRVTRHFPLYYPLTGKRVLVSMGWLDAEAVRQRQLVDVPSASSDMNYPINALECSTEEQPMNVVVVAVDAMRSDMLNPVVMPNLFELTTHKYAQNFTDHFSGGNVTKSGLFSLFYSLPATYWDGFAASGGGAQWIKQHQEDGYQMGIFSSSTLLSPAFDRTIFASIPSLRLRSEGIGPSARDKQSIDDFEHFLKQRSRDEPYFGFLFLDSAHGYDVPDGFEKFKTQWDRVDHVKLNNEFDREPYFNRYKNSLYFLDHEIGHLFDRMSARGDMDNTVVIVTSDHGEEFNDLKQNYWGHGSNFSKYQTQVPLLVIWPNKDRQVILYRTSHYDVAPTILTELLGCKNPMSDYSVGKNLFDRHSQRRWLLIHSYFNYGLVTPDRIVSTFPVGGYEIRDQFNKLIVNAELDSRTGLEVLREVSRFYR